MSWLLVWGFGAVLAIWPAFRFMWWVCTEKWDQKGLQGEDKVLGLLATLFWPLTIPAWVLCVLFRTGIDFIVDITKPRHIREREVKEKYRSLLDLRQEDFRSSADSVRHRCR